MTAQTASCRCGKLQITVAGDPVRVSVCHCLDCQMRSGSAFAVQARWPVGQVKFEGESCGYVHRGESGNVTRFHFCPACGGNLYYIHDHAPETVAIALGAFGDPYFLTPRISVWEERKHSWVAIAGEGIEHID